jgi:hypothetical protein
MREPCDIYCMSLRELRIEEKWAGNYLREIRRLSRKRERELKAESNPRSPAFTRVPKSRR